MVVNGSSDIVITPGSTIRERINFGFDLAGVTLTVADFNRAALAQATLSIIDEAAGIVELGLAAEHTTSPTVGGPANLRPGRTNYFALRADFALSGATIVFDRQWIEVLPDV